MTPRRNSTARGTTSPTREEARFPNALGEWLLAQIEEASGLEPPLRFTEPRRFGDVEVGGPDDAVQQLKALSRPFLDWAGKAERLSFDVPTLPLFVHERLSTKAILKTLKGHERDRQMEMQLFADPQLPLHQQLEAYDRTRRLGSSDRGEMRSRPLVRPGWGR